MKWWPWLWKLRHMSCSPSQDTPPFSLAVAPGFSVAAQNLHWALHTIDCLEPPEQMVCGVCGTRSVGVGILEIFGQNPWLVDVKEFFPFFGHKDKCSIYSPGFLKKVSPTVHFMYVPLVFPNLLFPFCAKSTLVASVSESLFPQKKGADRDWLKFANRLPPEPTNSQAPECASNTSP